MLKLKLQSFGHLMQRANSLEKTMMLWKIEGRKRSGWQRTRWLDSITDSTDLSWRWWRTRRPGMLQSMEFQRVGYYYYWRTDHNNKMLTYRIKGGDCWQIQILGIYFPQETLEYHRWKPLGKYFQPSSQWFWEALICTKETEFYLNIMMGWIMHIQYIDI